MQKEDLQLFGLVEFRPDEGAIYCKDERLLIVSALAFGALQKQLISTLGAMEAKKVQRKFGYRYGFSNYLTAEQIFGKRHEGSIIGPRFPELMGFLKSEILHVEEGSAPPSFRIHLRYRNSVEAEQYLINNVGPSEFPVCSWSIAFASGYCSAAFGLEIYFEEQQCMGQGFPCCDVIGQDAQLWGSEVERLRSECDFSDREEVEEVWREQRELHCHLRKQRETVLGTSTLRDKATTKNISRARASELAEQGKFIVREDAMLGALEQAISVAHLNTPVLVHGETGSGKEFVINLIHQQSARGKQNLISVNCAALTESLLESELFGHVRGAFTGAVADRPGLFELASDGTLFLDEVGEMPLSLQAKLLRVLENGEVRRVGSPHTIRTNARILAATHRDLQAMVALGEFRQDLYFRLNCIVIGLPALRERRDSIPALVQYFLAETSKSFRRTVLSVTPEVLSSLLSYGWPGNVRELKHAIERAVLVAHDGVVRICDLPSEITHPVQGNTNPQNPQIVRMDLKAGERQMIERVLAQHQGNRMATATALNISVSTLWRKMRRHQLL